ncbi:MAG: hypothetical protein QOG21_1242 [Actinomycetota bacterium]|nr:hypothetical protein [Actinomycetota bacterium]
MISALSEVVIDGYTRSASTFAVYAFQLAQSRPVRMAHHLHAPAQLIAAAKMGKPTLLVIREPKGAILSQLIREPEVTLANALVAYARFHNCLMPYRSSFIVGDFEEVTRDFGSVIHRMNLRFGTSFGEFDHSDTNTKLCLDLIKHRPTTIPAWRATLLGFESGTVTKDQLHRDQERYANEPQASGVTETWVPSIERELQKESLNESWLQPKLSSRRRDAEASYRALVGSDSGSPQR